MPVFHILWQPHLIKDILKMARIQRRATKYILGGYISGYKIHLGWLHIGLHVAPHIHLDLLPLVSEFEITDILFFIRSLKSSASHFDITNYISFCDNATGTHMRLMHYHSTTLLPITHIPSNCLVYRTVCHLMNQPTRSNVHLMCSEHTLRVTLTHLYPTASTWSVSVFVLAHPTQHPLINYCSPTLLI